MVRPAISEFLLGLGIGYIVMGGSWILIPSRGRELGVEWLVGVSPPLAGALWIVAGTLALATLAGASVRLALAALQAVPVFLAFVFLVSTILAWMPDWVIHSGNPTGWVTSVSYLLIAAGPLFAARQIGASREEPA